VTGRAPLGLALLVGLVLAQQPDSLETRPALPDSAAESDTVRPYRPAKSPGKAVLLSFLLPGGGQVYTGTWWKAALIAPAEVTVGYFSIREHLAATEAQESGDTTGYVQHRNRRTALLWWTGAVTAFSMADAYVSAQMYGFDREMRLTIGPMRAGIAMEF
jgi:hypothetical protein